MKNLLLIAALAFLASNCRQPASQELEKLQQQVQQLQAELAKLESNAGTTGALAHIVFLKLREDLSADERAAVLKEIKKLEAIELAKGFRMGDRADTGDERFISGHDLVFDMHFSSMEDYKAYQQLEAHRQVKAALLPYLSGPPAVFDYFLD